MKRSRKWRIGVVGSLDGTGFRRLQETPEVELLRLSESDSQAFARQLARCDALILSDGPPLDAPTLAGALRLRVIAQTGTDLRGIDLEAASR